MEGGRRRLFCLAMQSRRRRKKVGDARCGKTSEAKPVFGQTYPFEDAWVRPVTENPVKTAMAAVGLRTNAVAVAPIGFGKALTLNVKIEPALSWWVEVSAALRDPPRHADDPSIARALRGRCIDAVGGDGRSHLDPPQRRLRPDTQGIPARRGASREWTRRCQTLRRYATPLRPGRASSGAASRISAETPTKSAPTMQKICRHTSEGTASLVMPWTRA